MKQFEAPEDTALQLAKNSVRSLDSIDQEIDDSSSLTSSLERFRHHDLKETTDVLVLSSGFQAVSPSGAEI